MTNEIDLFFEESLLNNNIRRAEAIENMSYRLNFELTKELYQLYID
ncbi:hypothetical protein HOF65_04915 [bacterium]|jgi:hypothetical protein|nr:hypothetical protein [bacterium]